MYKNMNLNTSMAITRIDKAEDIGNVVVELCSFDCDINGDNGDEYLWESAKEKGFETDADYLASEAIDNLKGKEIDVETVEDAVTDALVIWLNNDCYYHRWEVCVKELDGVYALSLSACTD